MTNWVMEPPKLLVDVIDLIDDHHLRWKSHTEQRYWERYKWGLREWEYDRLCQLASESRHREIRIKGKVGGPLRVFRYNGKTVYAVTSKTGRIKTVLTKRQAIKSYGTMVLKHRAQAKLEEL